MTAINQNFADFSHGARPVQPSLGRGAAQSQVNLRPGGSVSAMLLRLLGGCMVLASIGIWLAPEAGADPQLALVRMGITVFLMFLGLCLLLQRETADQPEFQFDARRGEMRIEEIRADGRPVVVMRRSYRSLGAARFSDKTLQIIEANGTILLELPLEGRATRRLLMSQIRPHLPILD